MSSPRQKSITSQSLDFTVAPRQQTFPFPHTPCPLDHVTHEFLACDVRSTCWSDNDDTRQAWGFPWRGLCESQRNLLPAFTCHDGVTHVPYTLVCDHRDDCHDGSDETFCTFPPCHGPRPLQVWGFFTGTGGMGRSRRVGGGGGRGGWGGLNRHLLMFVGCLTSQKHAHASQGRICADNFTCCHYLAQSQYTDTGPTNPNTDPVTLREGGERKRDDDGERR